METCKNTNTLLKEGKKGDAGNGGQASHSRGCRGMKGLLFTSPPGSRPRGRHEAGHKGQAGLGQAGVDYKWGAVPASSHGVWLPLLLQTQGWGQGHGVDMSIREDTGSQTTGRKRESRGAAAHSANPTRHPCSAQPPGTSRVGSTGFVLAFPPHPGTG